MTVPQGATDAQVREAMAGVPVQELRATVFLRNGAVAVTALVVLALVVALVRTATGDGPGVASLLVLLVLSAVLSLAAVGLTRSRVHLGPDGVRTSLGRLRAVRWEQVDRIGVVFRPGTSTSVTLEHEGARMLLSSTAVAFAPVLQAVLVLRTVRPGLLSPEDDAQLQRALPRWSVS